MFIDRETHLGQTYLRISAEGMNPLIQCIVRPGVTSQMVLDAINDAVTGALAALSLESECGLNDRPPFHLDSESVVLSAADEAARWERSRAILAESFNVADEARQLRINEHPDNGKTGWWFVDGIRHDCRVRASTAREAIDAALASGEVGSWESPEASFIGESPAVM